MGELRRCTCRRSLDTQSSSTLVHSFVSSRVDYCNALLAGAPKVTTDKLQRVVNAATRVITGTHKFDRGLSRLQHWLNVPEQVTYNMVHSCLQGQAPQYLVDLCLLVSDVASRQHLRSASRRLLAMVLPRHRLQTYIRPTGFLRCWPVGLELIAWQFERSECHQRQLPQTFEKLKTHLFALY